MGRFFLKTRRSLAIHAIVLIAVTVPAAGRQRTASKQPGARLLEAKAESVGMSTDRLTKIDEAVLQSISRKETPGAVVLVARCGRVVYRKAFGDRAVEPQREQMTIDTIFDVASLTKVVATATSIMILVERGKLS